MDDIIINRILGTYVKRNNFDFQLNLGMSYLAIAEREKWAISDTDNDKLLRVNLANSTYFIATKKDNTILSFTIGDIGFYLDSGLAIGDGREKATLIYGDLLKEIMDDWYEYGSSNDSYLIQLKFSSNKLVQMYIGNGGD